MRVFRIFLRHEIAFWIKLMIILLGYNFDTKLTSQANTNSGSSDVVGNSKLERREHSRAAQRYH